jgi:hypothetical protein
MKSLLVLGKGDTPYSDRNRARLVDYAKKAGFDVQQADHHEIGKVSGFRSETVNVMFFFPFTFWNANCEVPKDTGLYGTSRVAYEKFRDHVREVGDQLGQRFEGHRLHYVIPPESAPIDRDKVETIKRLRAPGVPTSESVPYDSLGGILDNVTPERGVFIKCRYGAEGKGITALHHGKWVTNYRVEGTGLTNYGVHGKWPFTDITGREDLLRQLLEREVIVEREILSPNRFSGMKFDLRAFVIGRKVPHLFIRVNAIENVVTNYSQGAVVKHHPETGLGGQCLRLVRQIARKAADAMGLGYAGVDIMFDGHLSNPKVVEVQAFTDFPDITKFDLPRYMIGEKSGLFI